MTWVRTNTGPATPRYGLPVSDQVMLEFPVASTGRLTTGTATGTAARRAQLITFS